MSQNSTKNCRHCKKELRKDLDLATDPLQKKLTFMHLKEVFVICFAIEKVVKRKENFSTNKKCRKGWYSPASKGTNIVKTSLI